MKTTTTIRVLGDTWKVPRGFGREYLRIAKLDLQRAGRGEPGKIIDGLRDLLLLVGYNASREVIADWPLRKRVEASVYAANLHLRASDNPLQRHPKPAWLPEPWRGLTASENERPTVLR